MTSHYAFIGTTCEKCGQEFTATDTQYDLVFKCPHCGHENPGWTSSDTANWASSSKGDAQ